MQNYLITIVGPTAIGKTALSIKLAQYFNAPIVSCDSRQFFKEMTIGTAVPDQEELNAAKHYFIQNKSVHQEYSVGHFEKEVIPKLEALFIQNNIVIMVGGSGLYVDAVHKGLDYFPKIKPEIRADLNKKLENEGIIALQNQLKKLDIDTYNNIALDNPHRIIRALEICIGTGHTFSSYKNKPKAKRNFTPINIGLNADRVLLYKRINKRVDLMIENGLLEEAKPLHDLKHLNALQTVGYKELFEYFENKISLEFAIEEIKKNSRRYAKRQLTWFKKNEQTKWFDFEYQLSDVLNHIKNTTQT